MPPFSDLPAVSGDDRRALLTRARQAIVETILYHRPADLPPPFGRLAAPGRAFVTVRCFSRLRGCIGRMDATLSLAETVTQCAIGAALHDPRFPSLGVDDLPSLEIEISVLSESAPIAPDAIQPGRHGLLVMNGTRRGLLLPQVAVEHRWSGERFLAETCEKAGLHRDAWRDAGTQILAFTADVFSDAGLAPA